jgi:uncharacterized membrane protein YfcA
MKSPTNRMPRISESTGSGMDEMESQELLLDDTSVSSSTSCFDDTVDFVITYYNVLMFGCIPVAWLMVFVYYMDSESVLTLTHIPLIGFAATIIANCVPIGGGVVYIPALYLLGENMKLGVAFTLATTSAGSGGMTVLKYLSVDKNLIHWQVIPYTVIPAWAGFFVSTTLPSLAPETVTNLFAGFCVALSAFVFVLARAGGALEFARKVPACTSRSPTVFWSITALISFLAGLILVPNIGIGPALTTFICLSLHGSIDTHAALVTGIVVGGWACWVPFAVHLFIMDDVPVKHCLMALPGIFLGAQVYFCIYNLAL